MFTRYIENLAGTLTIEMDWDDMSDPQNSVGWIATVQGNPGDEDWQPVGPNVAEEYREIQKIDSSEKRWDAFKALVERTFIEAKAEAERTMG